MILIVGEVLVYILPAIKVYNQREVDELILLNISASFIR